jgi:hypothetical protein
MSKAVVAVAGVLGLAAYIFIYATGVAHPPIRSDGFSYYVYLPSWFIFHDLSLREVARDCCGGEFPEFSAIIRWPGTRRWVNAHPIGVAIMQAPFFLLAHLLTKWSNLSPDGFTFYYQHSAGLAGLFWMVAGLVALRRLLLRQFNDRITAATLFVLTFATSLFHYGTYDSSYSHVYSFFLFSVFMVLTDTWYRSPRRFTSWLLGATAGLIVLTRHPNALFLVVFPLYGVTRGEALLGRIREFKRRLPDLLKVAVAAALVVTPQLLIYFFATGRPLISSYGSLGFNFSEPQLFGVLFSVQKGVFFWAPILLIGVVGLIASRGMARSFAFPAGVFLIVNSYVIASWWDWQFGASFGHRGFVDSYPLLALGIADVFDRIAHRTMLVLATSVVALTAAIVSTVQMLQYWYHVMPMSDTTWEQYRAVFMQLR